MKIEVSVFDFAKLVQEVEGDIAKAATEAMRETTPDAKQELRDQIVAAGLGQRLANTWRGDVYPKSRQSMNPAGYIHSNAPDIVESFVRGATIVPVRGARYLAIPTKSVPPSLGSRGKRPMTPTEVEHSFNQDLVYVPAKNGRVLAFLDANAKRNGRRVKRPAGRGRAQGRSAKRVLMFTLVPTVRMPKLLDLDGPARRWADSFATALSRKLG